MQSDGRGLELVTPPLDGTVLPGVTRDSILQLTRSWREFDVSERPLTVGELRQVILLLIPPTDPFQQERFVDVLVTPIIAAAQVRDVSLRHLERGDS